MLNETIAEQLDDTETEEALILLAELTERGAVDDAEDLTDHQRALAERISVLRHNLPGA
jgi:hypothetical protein